MAYRFNGIECDTAEEALALQAAGSKPSKKLGKKRTDDMPPETREVVKRRGRKKKSGQSKFWDRVRALAEKEGITSAEARTRLAKK